MAFHGADSSHHSTTIEVHHLMSKNKFSTFLGAAVASSLVGVAGASENPFAAKDLTSGYVQLAEAGKETKEMVCGEGKCGGQKMQSPEMNCGAMMEQAKKTPDQESKAMEGKCAGMNMGQPANAPATPSN
jgi:uncharacterized low-complexity protein